MNNVETKAIYFPEVRLIDPATDRDEVGPLYISEDGLIAAVPEKLPSAKRLMVIDEPGLTVMPGLCDVHVHFRDPGIPEAEDSLSGACAAANGGFTRVVTMPNTNPPTDTPDLIRRQRHGSFPVTIYPSACATQGRAGREPAAIETLASAGAVAFTDDGAMISNSEVMKKVMLRAKQKNCCVMDHAVLPELAKGGVIRECPLAETLGLPIFPPEAEVEAVRADIALCKATGCALNIQHLSCAESVELVRAARAEGLPVTAEVTPHHLALCAEEIPGDDGNFRMNPPLGTARDREALRAGLLDGTLTIFATDHAPHPRLSKQKGFKAAPFGVIGLETAVSVTWSVMVRELGMSPIAWAKNWITHPNALIGLQPPTLAEGARAELAVFAFDQSWTVDPATFASKSINTPFTGMTFYGQPRAIYRNGRYRPSTCIR